MTNENFFTQRRKKWDDYPYKVYVNVLLKDGMIVNWKVGQTHWDTINRALQNTQPIYLLKSGVISVENDYMEVCDTYQNRLAFGIFADTFLRKFPIHPDFPKRMAKPYHGEAILPNKLDEDSCIEIGTTISEWDEHYYKMARLFAQKSKDPSTKCGAIIVKEGKIHVSSGFNGFAMGVKDTAERLNDRETRYDCTVHSEVNAILFAKQDLKGCAMFVYPMEPCVRCAAVILQVGISHIYSVEPSEELIERWGKEIKLARSMYAETGTKLTLISEEKMSQL